jgi:hypothetical protein
MNMIRSSFSVFDRGSLSLLSMIEVMISSEFLLKNLTKSTIYSFFSSGGTSESDCDSSRSSKTLKGFFCATFTSSTNFTLD